MTQKFSIDRSTREGSAFFEQLTELPWQTPNEVFPDVKFEAVGMKISTGKIIDKVALKKPSNRLPFLYRGHGVPNPDMTGDGFVHATPFPDNAILQYCLRNSCGRAGIKLPEWHGEMGTDFARIAFLSVYESKPDQLFYNDEELADKIKRGIERGKRLADITVFNEMEHYETLVANGENPLSMYVVTGLNGLVVFDKPQTEAFGRLDRPSRLACIKENNEFTENGQRFLREYQRAALAAMPDIKSEVLCAPGLR